MQTMFVFLPTWVLVFAAIIFGLVLLFRSLPQGSGPKVGLALAGLLAVSFFLLFFGYNRTMQLRPASADAIQQARAVATPRGESSSPNAEALKPRIDLGNEAQSSEPQPSTASETSETKPAAKPAWLTQGTQTGNGVSQFPVSSELFATVAECQRDLDSRMPALIAEELRFLIGEEFPIPLLPGEDKRLTAETYTEEVPTTSQGNWYKVHRLIKVDEVAWAGIRERFHREKTYARLKSLGQSFGGLMLVIGVVYLVLRRKPRVVDPTLNTFSTT